MKPSRWILLVAVAATACSGDPGPAQQPQNTQSTTPATPAPAAGMQDRAGFGGLSFQVPDRWVAEEPSSSMRKAQYRLPGSEGAEDGECALFMFPGTGGTVEANLQRWYAQFTQPDGGSTEELARRDSFDAGGLPVTLVDVTGTYSGGMMSAEPKPGYRMVAGIVETAVSPWFLKCTGPESTMEQAAPEVRAALETVQVP